MILAENDTLLTGLSGLIILIIVIWVVLHFIRRG